MNGANVIVDCAALPQRVMGTNNEDLDGPNDWKRGGRGWGTHGSSIFQQSLLNVIYPLDQSIELGEAAADMFLNWVYRRQTDPMGAASGDKCTNRTGIGTWLGFRNINTDGTLDDRLPGNARYWWMEEKMGLIFGQQANWN
jgi:hypothetical protein